MCFYIHPDYPEAITAIDNIPCYKVFIKTSRGNYYSSYRKEKYFNKESNSPVIKKVNDFKKNKQTITKGIHSFTTLKAAFESIETLVFFAPPNQKFSINKAMIKHTILL